jgi:hypothetical protein
MPCKQSPLRKCRTGCCCCSSALCLRSFTETILLLKYYKYVHAVANAVLSCALAAAEPDADGAGSTGRTALSPHAPSTGPPSRHGSSTVICCGAWILRLPMLLGQTQR